MYQNIEHEGEIDIRFVVQLNFDPRIHYLYPWSPYLMADALFLVI